MILWLVFTLFFRFTVCDQCANIDLEVVAQLADEPGIDSLKFVLTVTVEIGAWYIQVFAKLIFRDTTIFQDLLDVKCQFAVIHNTSLFTLLTLLYIMGPRLIILYLVSHYIAIYKAERGIMRNICAFFGHREIWADISEPLEQAVRSSIADGVTEFWVGGYGAFDAQAAECVRRLKREYPAITLHLIVAYLPAKKDTFDDLYDSIVYPEGLEFGPQRFAITKRNRWIVENCDMVIAYVRSTYGGAYTALQLARRKERHIINIAEQPSKTPPPYLLSDSTWN